MEPRALLSFGGGSIDPSIPRVPSTAPSLNFTSNTFHQINNQIPGVAATVVANPNNTSVDQAALMSLVARIPYGQSKLLPLLEADLQTFEQGTLPITEAEATTTLNNLYAGLLNRTPDPGALAVGVPALEAGTLTVSQIAANLAVSQEYLNENTTVGATTAANQAQFVTSLYTNVLLRSPDQAGLNFWENQLSTGALTTSQVATNFVYSSESQTSAGSLIGLNTPAATQYYFGTVVPGGPITGNFGSSPGISKTVQVENLLQRDILTYLGDGIGTSFNILKSHVNFSSDKLLTYNGRV